MLLRTATTICLFCLTATWVGSVSTAAEGRSQVTEREALESEVKRLIESLDSGRFDARRRAAVRLESLAARPELGQFLAREFRRLLVSPRVSFEVRSQLKRLLRKLPEASPEPAEEVSPEEIDRLVRQLEDESYGVRLGANRRLEWLLASPKMVCPIMVRLKRRLARSALPADARQWLEPIYERARGTWLLSGSTECRLPPVSDAQIAGWIEDLVRPAPQHVPSGKQHTHRMAARELSDLLACDEAMPRVKRALEARLARDDLDPAADARLRELLDLTRPALVAEYWMGRKHMGEQHLLVGVPSMSQGAKRPSHFDRIDDRVAHCVSGNSLSPGDYPVGVAFPHPLQYGALFHLVNLPTPRRRMAYTYYVKTDETTRLIALSRRTLDRLLSQKRPLDEPELIMLSSLDPGEVSRFAGKYLVGVADQPLPAERAVLTGPALQPRPVRHTVHPVLRGIGRPSRHGMLCALLAVEGTKEAVPGLLEAIDKRRFLPPGETAPFKLHWLAALAIARRDPWPDTDHWLARLVDHTEPLVEDQPNTAGLGATAAALLLERHGRGTFSYDLQSAGDLSVKRFGVEGYRFRSPAGIKKVKVWWENRSDRAKSKLPD